MRLNTSNAEHTANFAIQLASDGGDKQTKPSDIWTIIDRKNVGSVSVTEVQAAEVQDEEFSNVL
jgi:hypothetical protein